MNQPLDPRVQENNELQNQVQFNDDDEKKLYSNEQQNNNLSEGPKEYQTNIPMTENTNGNNISENNYKPYKQSEVRVNDQKNYMYDKVDYETYDIIKILIVYMVQTAICEAFCKFKVLRADKVLYWPEITIALIACFLLITIRGYDGKYSDSKCCSVFLFIIFFIFKICFFIYIYYIVEIIDYKYIYCSKSESHKAIRDINRTSLGNFDFLNMTVFAYYLTLLIFTAIKKRVVFLFYSLMGLGISLTMFFSLFAIDIPFAGFTLLLIAIEIGLFLLVLKITIAKKKLEEHEFLNNILILDYYKYIVFMVISFLFLALIYYIIYCFCMILKCICESCESKATKVDDKGNVYDQFGNFMAHYSKRPVAVDSEGNVYDKHHNKIEPDGCHIF